MLWALGGSCGPLEGAGTVLPPKPCHQSHEALKALCAHRGLRKEACGHMMPPLWRYPCLATCRHPWHYPCLAVTSPLMGHGVPLCLAV